MKYHGITTGFFFLPTKLLILPTKHLVGRIAGNGGENCACPRLLEGAVVAADDDGGHASDASVAGQRCRYDADSTCARGSSSELREVRTASCVPSLPQTLCATEVEEFMREITGAPAGFPVPQPHITPAYLNVPRCTQMCTALAQAHSQGAQGQGLHTQEELEGAIGQGWQAREGGGHGAAAVR